VTASHWDSTPRTKIYKMKKSSPLLKKHKLWFIPAIRLKHVRIESKEVPIQERLMSHHENLKQSTVKDINNWTRLQDLKVFFTVNASDYSVFYSFGNIKAHQSSVVFVKNDVLDVPNRSTSVSSPNGQLIDWSGGQPMSSGAQLKPTCSEFI